MNASTYKACRYLMEVCNESIEAGELAFAGLELIRDDPSFLNNNNVNSVLRGLQNALDKSKMVRMSSHAPLPDLFLHLLPPILFLACSQIQSLILTIFWAS